MALPADFSKIYGSTATDGLTPISNVNYAKGWEFVGSNPPTKNDFSYLQNLSDLKSQWLYSNKLQRTDPFGDIKSDGAEAVSKALANLGLGDGRFVSAGGGQYGADFTFKSFSTMPTDRNGVEIFSAPAGTAAGQIVSGAVFAWYDDYYRIGHARSATTASGGFVIERAGVRQFALSPAGEASAIGDIRAGRNIIAAGGVFETEPDGINYTRVYSAHNPPTNMVSGLRMVRQPAIQTGNYGGTLPSGGFLVGGNFDDAQQFMEWAYLQAYMNGAWVTILW